MIFKIQSQNWWQINRMDVGNAAEAVLDGNFCVWWWWRGKYDENHKNCQFFHHQGMVGVIKLNFLKNKDKTMPY